MAEVLGAVASGLGVAAFAIQIAESIVKIKGFVDNVKDAPEEIRDNIQHIEIMGKLLADVEMSCANDELLDIRSSSATECLELCRKSVKVLEEIVQNMNKALVMRRRFGVGKVQVALKKGVLDRLNKRLDAANMLLMLSHQTYLGALQRRRHELQMEFAIQHQHRLEEVKVVVAETNHLQIASKRSEIGGYTCQPLVKPDSLEQVFPAEGQYQSLEKRNKRAKQTGQAQERLLARIMAPYWFPITSRVWEFYSSKACSGWTVTFRQYNTVDPDAPVFQCARTGDLEGLQILFSSGKATPFDSFYPNNTLLYFAAMNKDLAMCRFLVENGAELTHFHDIYDYPFVLHHILEETSSEDDGNRAGNEGDANELFRFIVDRTGGELFSISFLCARLIRITTSTLRWYLQGLYLSFTESNLSQRISIAENICQSWRAPNIASLVRCVIRPDELSFDVGTHAMGLCGSLFKDFVQKEMSQRFPLASSPRWVPQAKEDLIALIEEILHFSDPNEGFYFDRTISSPLDKILQSWNGYIFDLGAGYRDEYHQVLLLAVHTWLDILLRAGFDLVKYGDQEWSRHIDSDDESLLVRRSKNISWGYRMNCIRIIGLTYGPQPTDWHLWTSENFPNYFRQFWEMVDHPEWAVPGAWICFDDLSSHSDFDDGEGDLDYYGFEWDRRSKRERGNEGRMLDKDILSTLQQGL